MTFDLLLWTVYGFTVAGFIACLIWFATVLRIAWLDAKVKRYRAQNTYHPDHFGNKPSFFDPTLGVVIDFEPGQLPERTPTYLVGNSFAEIPTTRQKRPSQIIRSNGSISNFDVTEISVNEDLPDCNSTEMTVNSGKFTDLLPALELAILRGEGKTATLHRLGQSGRNYKQASLAWDELAQKLRKG